MQRDLTGVLDSILVIIPGTETALIAELGALKSSAAFAAPEISQSLWWKGAQILANYFPSSEDSLSEWQAQVVNIWTARDCKN